MRDEKFVPCDRVNNWFPAGCRAATCANLRADVFVLTAFKSFAAGQPIAADSDNCPSLIGISAQTVVLSTIDLDGRQNSRVTEHRGT